MPAGIQLHPDVSFCRVSGTFVFLDAGKDRYSCLKGVQAHWFEAILHEEQGTLPSAGKPGFLDHLMEIRVLTRPPSPGQPLASCQHPPARSSLLDTSNPHAPARGGTIRFLATLLACTPSKRPRTIQGLLHDIRQRKERLHEGAPAEEARMLARQFHSLAPYFITRHDACLSRSYLLMRYLASAGVKADWVFGVRLSPFSAHCWVEYQGCVLNEHLDTTLEFQPILSA